MQTIAYSGTKIITPYKTYDPADPSDEEFFELKLFFARREYAQIKRRMQTGRISSVLAGLYIGSKPPYGYKRKKLENEKGWMLEIAPEEAAVVRQIFEWYLRGENGEELGCSKIAARLTEMGIRPREKSKWGAETILQMQKIPCTPGKSRGVGIPRKRKSKMANGKGLTATTGSKSFATDGMKRL